MSTTIMGIGAVTAADFGGGSPYLNVTIAAGQSVDGVLAWAQPSASYGGAGAQNSLAVYLLDSSGNVVASSTGNNVGGDATNKFSFTNNTSGTGFRIVVVQNGGVIPAGELFKFIWYNGGGIIDNANAGQGSGTLQGHEFLPGINSVAAVNYASTPAFNAAPIIDSYSSRGQGNILYGANGTPLSVVPNEPQFSSVDGTDANAANTNGGFSPFDGTSAAAPAAGAVSALILQANATLSTTQITSILVQSTIPASGTGYNGAGLIQARAAVEIGAADKGARWTTAAGGNWTSAASWSGHAMPTTAQAASLDDNFGGFTGNYTVTVNTGHDVAGSLAIATPSGSSATVLITTGGSLAIGGSAAANITAGDLLVSDNGTLRMTGGGLSVTGSLNVNNGTVVFQAGNAKAGNYTQNAGSLSLGGAGAAAFLTLTAAGFSGAAAFAETGGVVTIGSAGTLTSGSVSASAATLTDALGGLINDTGTATFTSGTVVDSGIFTATSATVTQSTFTDSGHWTDSAALNFTDSTATVALGGFLSVAALTIGNTFTNFMSTLLDAGNIVDTGGLGIGTSNAAGTISIGTGATLSIGGTVDSNNIINFAANGLLTFASTVANTVQNQLLATIGGFAQNVGRIDFTSLAYNAKDTTSYNSGDGDVAVFDQNGSILANVFLDTAGNYAGFKLQSNGAANKLELVVACFAAGTRILTTLGEVAVEDLSVGDVAITHEHSSGSSGRIAWIGQRRTDVAGHPNPERVRPIRFAAGSIGAGMPRRQLLLSPDHALFFDGVLIQARQLVNGPSITTVDVTSVRYFHVELDRHAILFADGVPVESYLDTGNRNAFEDDGVITLHPDFERAEHPDSCAPLTTDAAMVRPIWERLAIRAGLTGHGPAVTRDAELMVVLPDGRALTPQWVGADGRHVFAVPASGIVRLRSRHAAPADIMPWLDDRRRLGVCIGAVVAWADRGASPSGAALLDGWWAPEQVDGQVRRWTDGNAAVELPAGCRRLDVTVVATAEYPIVEAWAGTGMRAA